MTTNAGSFFAEQWMRQPWGLLVAAGAPPHRSIEVRRNLFSWRAGWIYFLAFIPTLIIFIHSALIVIYHHH